MTRHVHDSIARPKRAPVRRLSDSATPRKFTRGVKLTGTRFNRATPPRTRYVAPVPVANRETVRANTWRNDGLRAYSDTRGRLFA